MRFSGSAFDRFLDDLCDALGHADRHEGLKGYCRGVMLPLERKSVEPLAAHLDPRRVRALHQSLHHFVAKSEWSDAAVLARARAHVVAAMDPDERRYWIVDDTGFRKHGRHSVGVARQYCGEIGKQDNCQVAVSVSLATVSASVPIAWRLYLPEEWALDRTRRAKAGVPEAVGFATKPQIALEQLQEAKATNVPQGVVLADAGYGTNTAWRDALTAEGLNYVVGVISSLKIWPEGDQPLPAAYSGRGRPPVRRPRSADGELLTVEQYAKSLDLRRYRSVTWREGSKQALTSRFAAVRVHAAHGDHVRSAEWLLVEWPSRADEPRKYFLSNLPETTTLRRLVEDCKARWRIERDYQDLKQEFGLDHYEGRGWRGFHHHATLCIAAYAFLVAQRLAGRRQKKPSDSPRPRLPRGYRARGAPARATSRA
jgi:SRSO17 transposase